MSIDSKVYFSFRGVDKGDIGRKLRGIVFLQEWADCERLVFYETRKIESRTQAEYVENIRGETIVVLIVVVIVEVDLY